MTPTRRILLPAGLAALVLLAPLPAQDLQLRIPGSTRKAETAQPHAEVTQIEVSVSMNLATGHAYRNISVGGQLFVPDGVDVVGISHRVQLTTLTDGSGADLLQEWRKGPQAFFESQRYYAAIADFRDNNEPYSPMPIMASVNNLGALPDRFGLLQGTAWVLVATRRAEREIRPVEPGNLVELTPSLALRITKVRREPNTLELTMEYEAEDSDPFFNPNIPAPIIDAVVLMDHLGTPLVRKRWGVQRQGVNGALFTGQAQATFELPEGREPGYLRLQVVTETQERRVEFSARDIKLPIEAN